MTLMIGLHHFFLEISKKCWPRFRFRNSTEKILLINFLKTRKISGLFVVSMTTAPNASFLLDVPYRGAIVLKF
jgi:hypothetical protein